MLKKYDVVLTTYGKVTAEMPDLEKRKKKGDLHKVKWLRIVLDEAHNIKNPKAKQSKAVCNLDASYRWTLTGTPVQNTVDDLFSLVSFLRVPGCSDYEWWRTTISQGAKSGSMSHRQKAYDRLKVGRKFYLAFFAAFLLLFY